VWLIGAHYDHLPFFQVNGFAGDDDVCFSIKYMNRGIKRRRVFT